MSRQSSPPHRGGRSSHEEDALEPKDARPGGILSLLRLDSIRNRIVVLALLATLIPAFSTAVLSFQRTRRALTETLEGELQRAGSQGARELDLWVKERTYDLRVFVGSFEVTENLARIRGGGLPAADAYARLTDYLTGIQNRFVDYTELLATDADATPVASSRAEPEDPDLPPDWLPALSVGETTLGDPYWDDRAGAVVTKVGVPVMAADGGFLGILVATLTFDAVTEILGEFEPGDAGRIDLISADGRLIAASASTSRFEEALAPETLAELAATGGGTMEYVDNQGVEMVGTLTTVDRIGWSVLAHVPTEEAYARITQLRSTTFMLVSFLLVIVGAVAYFIGLFIVRPLDRLTAGATAVAAGDLSVDLPVSGSGEVAMLTQVFNGMVGEIRASREKLDEANSVLREQNSELEQISMTDALTELFNRRYVMGEFEKELNRAERHQRTLAVLMMDVDKFKQYNDSWGHQAGDEVLKGMGTVIRDAVREPDVPARYGGEEFIVLLPDCNLQGAIDAAERVRTRLAQEVFDGRKVTVSIGAAEFPTHGETPKTLISAADAALYQAKEQGRDRVVPAGAPDAAPPEKPATKKGAAKRRAPAKEKPAAQKKASAKKKAAAKKKAGPKKKASTGDSPVKKGPAQKKA